MKDIYALYEGLLKGQENTLSTGEKDINASLGIPTIDDFKWNSSGDSVFFPCADRLKNMVVADGVIEMHQACSLVLSKINLDVV